MKTYRYTAIITLLLFGSVISSPAPIYSETVPPFLHLLLTSTADSCPSDPLKTKPGVCGCGASDTDSNNDGIIDCLIKPGATDIRQFLVISDGTHSLGDPSLPFNTTRDQGSKLAYFNASTGDNATAEAYWWDGAHIVDSNGSTTNPDNGKIYGTDPMTPNEDAIKPFKEMVTSGDSRLRTQMSGSGPNGWRFSGLAGGYPDWYLFRRGQLHDTFDMRFAGGRSESEPLVATAYGPLNEGRAIMEPKNGTTSPFSGHNWGYEQSWLHQVLYSLEIRATYGYYGAHVADSYASGRGPVTAFIEDCHWPGLNSGIIVYPPQKTTIRRSIVSNSYKADSHNQGYYTSGFKNQVTFDEVIFYKNGYKTNPISDPDPRRTIFDRNFYQGGGAKMGHTYRNVLSADGGSGGPQMRLGGLMENSLIIEGYFYSSTSSNSPVNQWMEEAGQVGQSAIVRNNVQLIFGYPTINDPDTHGLSDTRAHPFWGYALQGATFGAAIQGNIISGAMTRDDLTNGSKLGNYGIHLAFSNEMYSNGTSYTQKNNSVEDNILYALSDGLRISGNALNINNITINSNVFVSSNTINSSATGLTTSNQLLVDNNRFYSNSSLPTTDWLGPNNSQAPFSSAKQTEKWTDPDRTLKRYVTEKLGLTLLDWDDNPSLDPGEKLLRTNASEDYDPAGLKTFMAIATNMRYGGKDPIPATGKPDMLADYPWDSRFTAISVVNWIREGFNLSTLR